MKKIFLSALFAVASFQSVAFADDYSDLFSDEFGESVVADSGDTLTVKRNVSVTGVDACRENEINISADGWGRDVETRSAGRLLYLSCSIVEGTFQRKHDTNSFGVSHCRASATLNCEFAKLL